MTDFQKKRYDRLEKKFTELFYLHNLNHGLCCANIVRDLIQAVIEVGKSIPNKTLKGNFFGVLPEYGDLMKLEDFQAHCRDSFFVDYDGYGHPVGSEAGFNEGQLRMDPNVTIIPSECDDIPEGTTHVVWFNR
jgi:hypothetical protein